MRILSERLSRHWGQQLVIDNKPGANGFIAIGDAKRAVPDGYNVPQLDNTRIFCNAAAEIALVLTLVEARGTGEH